MPRFFHSWGANRWLRLCHLACFRDFWFRVKQLEIGGSVQPFLFLGALTLNLICQVPKKKKICELLRILWKQNSNKFLLNQPESAVLFAARSSECYTRVESMLCSGELTQWSGLTPCEDRPPPQLSSQSPLWAGIRLRYGSHLLWYHSPPCPLWPGATDHCLLLRTCWACAHLKGCARAVASAWWALPLDLPLAAFSFVIQSSDCLI